MSNLNELINKGMVKLVEPKQTNADKIRSMSDEELAEWLDKMFNEDREDWKSIGCYNCIYKNTHHSIKGSNQYMCKDCCYENGLLAWLQSEVLE